MIAVGARTAPADMYSHCQEVPEYVAIKMALEASGKKSNYIPCAKSLLQNPNLP